MPIISQENQDALTQARLKSLLKYDPFTGNFWWKVNRRGTAKKNSVAGAVSTAGYRQIKINGPLYLSSRLAFLYMTGKWPKGYVDHINRNRADNRWENLRECTNAENQYNASIKKIIPAVFPAFATTKQIRNGMRGSIKTAKENISAFLTQSKKQPKPVQKPSQNITVSLLQIIRRRWADGFQDTRTGNPIHAVQGNGSSKAQRLPVMAA